VGLLHVIERRCDAGHGPEGGKGVNSTNPKGGMNIRSQNRTMGCRTPVRA